LLAGVARKEGEMLKRTLFAVVTAVGTLAFGANAQAVTYLQLGTSNTSNVTTTLRGSAAGAELRVEDTNGSVVTAGVLGLLSATSPTAVSSAVRGQNNATNGAGYGVYGSQAGSGVGVNGFTPSGTGVRGVSTNGTGVYGLHTSTSGGAPGVRGDTNAPGGIGVWGRTDSGYGVLGQGVYGVWGTGSSIGVVAQASDSGSYGLYAAGQGYGTVAYGSTYGSYGTGTYRGIYGSGGNAGVYGASDYVGLWGNATSTSGLNYGLYAATASPSGYAGVFTGRVYVGGDLHVAGTLTKSGGSFKIDHPLDPANKYLSHSFVESPDMMNVYNGNVRTNAHGFATVKLPAYFQALNRDFRYQLTIIGTRGWNARVVKKITHNRFTIQTDKPRVKVSWQVTGIRHDAWANAHRIRVETNKTAADRGKYLTPGAFGKPLSKAIRPTPRARELAQTPQAPRAPASLQR
jgi:hypothetical protein